MPGISGTERKGSGLWLCAIFFSASASACNVLVDAARPPRRSHTQETQSRSHTMALPPGAPPPKYLRLIATPSNSSLPLQKVLYFGAVYAPAFGAAHVALCVYKLGFLSVSAPTRGGLLPALVGLWIVVEAARRPRVARAGMRPGGFRELGSASAAVRPDRVPGETWRPAYVRTPQFWPRLPATPTPTPGSETRMRSTLITHCC